MRAILQDQAKLQGTVLRYGGVVSCKKTTNFPKEIRDLLNTLKKLPTTGQPKRLIELLEHPETAEVTWRQI